MGFNNQNSNCDNSPCESLCEQLGEVDLQCLGNVDTAGLSDGDILCYHAASGNFINISKSDIFEQFDIDIDGGTYTAYQIALTDGDSPDIVIDMSSLPQDLCSDPDFIACIASELSEMVGVATDSTLTGDGTNANPLSVDICAAIDSLPYLGPLVCA